MDVEQIKNFGVEQYQRNLAHVEKPEVGDYWHECFSPYFVVVHADDKQIIVCTKTKAVDSSHFQFDFNHCMQVDIEWIRNKVTYSTIRDKFVADVVTNPNRAAAMYNEWVELGKPYTVYVKPEECCVTQDDINRLSKVIADQQQILSTCLNRGSFSNTRENIRQALTRLEDLSKQCAENAEELSKLLVELKTP